MTAAPQLIVEPNFYSFEGDGLAITFARSTIDGSQELTYNDRHGPRAFRNDDLQIEQTAIGQLVTVVLASTPDLGRTTFTLAVPFVNLIARPALLHTLGVTILESSTLLGPRTSSYHVSRLHGLAEQIQTVTGAQN